MQKVVLIGDLAQFGEVWNTEYKDIASIFKLISCQAPGFRKYLIDAYDAGLDIEIVKGGDLILDPRELLMQIGSEDIIVTLCPAGEKSKFLRIVFAVALFVVAPHMGVLTQIAQGVAINLGLSVISEMLAPGPETQKVRKDIDGEEVGDKLFNGPVNVSKNGTVIPLLYGELIVGGAAISAEFFQIDDPSVGNGFIDSSIQDKTVKLYGR
tara:strand:+ start:229 stop:858 length:630 start_codon:yes stop_codon:yes gene_type:complete